MGYCIFKGVSDAIWRKYYYDWQTEKRRRQLLKESMLKMGNDGINVSREPVIVMSEPVNEPVKSTDEPVNEPVNPSNDIVNPPNDIVKCVRGSANDTVKSLIVQNPGITAVRIIEILNKSS